jgi:hypothetical protein
MFNLSKTRQNCQRRNAQKCASSCKAEPSTLLVTTIDDEILTLNATYSGVLTLKEAAARLQITEDEVSAMLEGYFWATPPHNTATDDNDTDEETIDPKIFESLFLEYIKLTNATEFSNSLKNQIIAKLDEMLSNFPFHTFPELSSTHFDWDDATRFVLIYIHESVVIDVIQKLRDEFWRIYSHRMCVIRDVITMKSQYYGALEVADKKIEDMRNEILETYCIPVEENMMYNMRFLH